MSLPALRHACSLALLLGLVAPASAVPILPQVGGIYRNGDGTNSSWVQVTNDWRGSLQGSQSWGTGIWGLADQAQVMSLTDSNPYVVQTLSAPVDQVNFANQRFIDAWGASWGSPGLAPIFDNHAGETQDNWASRFWGYIAITSPGAYNFGVLYDDGFRFSLFGANGISQSILVDGLNPRDRLGFSQDLMLLPGLYGFQLDAYDRLEAGVVQLAWLTPGASDWEVLPKAHLFTSPSTTSLSHAPAAAIPEPAGSMLMLAGLAAIGLSRRLK